MVGDDSVREAEVGAGVCAPKSVGQIAGEQRAQDGAGEQRGNRPDQGIAHGGMAAEEKAQAIGHSGGF